MTWVEIISGLYKLPVTNKFPFDIILPAETLPVVDMVFEPKLAKSVVTFELPYMPVNCDPLPSM